MTKTVESILKDLVSFPVLGGQSNLSILQYIENFLSEEGISYKLVPNEEGNKASIHCRIGPGKDDGVILSGHMDVVPVEGQQWSTDPFVLEEKNNRLYGRGSCDMKGFLACCLAALPYFKKANLQRPIYFAFSYDEEIGCLAAPELVEDLLASYSEIPKYAIIGEPSLLQPIVGQKGICVLETTVNGSAGHSSRILQEVSAIHEATRCITWLKNKMVNLADFENDARFNPPHSSIHIGMIHGGIAPNVIADSCAFKWDIRVIPKTNMDEVIAEFDEFCRRLEAENREKFADFSIITNTFHPAVPSLDTRDDAEIVHLVQSLVHNKSLGAVSYAAEAGQFSAAGLQAVICGPGSIAQAHRANEYIDKSQLYGGVEMLQRLADSLSSDY